MSQDTGVGKARRVIFRVIAGLIAAVFVPFTGAWLMLGGPPGGWVFSGLLLGLLFGVYAVTGRAPGRYAEGLFRRKEPKSEGSSVERDRNL
jgi:hypothetical protein